jgi:hypothetical protein
MGELYSRYHDRILRLATQATSDGAWKAKLREILAGSTTTAANFLYPAAGYSVASSQTKSITRYYAFLIRRKEQFSALLSSILTTIEGRVRPMCREQSASFPSEVGVGNRDR